MFFIISCETSMAGGSSSHNLLLALHVNFHKCHRKNTRSGNPSLGSNLQISTCYIINIFKKVAHMCMANVLFKNYQFDLFPFGVSDDCGIQVV